MEEKSRLWQVTNRHVLVVREQQHRGTTTNYWDAAHGILAISRCRGWV